MTIQKFQGEYRFLSNFWESSFEYEGRSWPTVEHAYQAMKTKDFEEQERIRNADSPDEAKSLGRSCDIRDDWEEVKLDVMAELVTEKFCQNRDLAEKLVDTHPERLVEGNFWGDDFWGVINGGDGQGENHLGKILMGVRQKLKNGDLP